MQHYRPASMFMVVLCIGLMIFSFLFIMIQRQISFVYYTLDAMGDVLSHQVLITREMVSDYGGVIVESREEYGDYCGEPAEDGYCFITADMFISKLARYADDYGMYTFTLVSDRPVNPLNTPNKVQLAALEAFNQNAPLVQELAREENMNYYYMVPLYTEASCLECHADHVAGDLLGVLSVTIPADKVLRELYIVIILYTIGGLVTFALATFVSINWLKRKLISPLADMHNSANTDCLTGLYNHRYFQGVLSYLLPQANAEQPLSLLFMDIDNFKNVNDTYGHPIGDEILSKLSSILSLGIRDTDTLARYGGEEFAALLPGAELNKAVEIAERLREMVAAHTFHTTAGPLKITISIGVSTTGDNMSQQQQLLNMADKALYQAKNEGRNKVCTHKE